MSGVPAVFFPAASALIDRRVLNVNKVQNILAASDVSRLVERIEAAIAERPALPRPDEYRRQWWKASRWDPPEVVYVKRLLQDALPEGVRRPLVDELFRSLISADERAFADELYMTVDDARAMLAGGMTIGAHGDRHVRLPTLSRDEPGRRDRWRAACSGCRWLVKAELRLLLRERGLQRGQPRAAACARLRSGRHDTARSGRNSMPSICSRCRASTPTICRSAQTRNRTSGLDAPRQPKMP